MPERIKSLFFYPAPGILRTGLSFIFIILLPFSEANRDLQYILSAIITLQIAESFGTAGIEAIVARRLSENGVFSKRDYYFLVASRVIVSSTVYITLSIIQLLSNGLHYSFFIFYPIILTSSLYSISFLMKYRNYANLFIFLIIYVSFCFLCLLSFIFLKEVFVYSYIFICAGFHVCAFPLIISSLCSGAGSYQSISDVFREWKYFLQFNSLKLSTGSGSLFVISIIFDPKILVYFFFLERGKSILVAVLSAFSTRINSLYVEKMFKFSKLNKMARELITVGFIFSLLQLCFFFVAANFYLDMSKINSLYWVYLYLFLPTFFCANHFIQNNIAPYYGIERFLVKIHIIQSVVVFASLLFAWASGRFSFFIIGLFFAEALVSIMLFKLFRSQASID